MSRPEEVRRLTVGALLSAAAVSLVCISGLFPSGRLGLVAAAGLAPGAALITAGPVCGWLVYAAASILALLLAPEKGCAFLFGLFFGLYPMVKYYIERLRRFVWEWVFKLFFFCGLFAVLMSFASKLFSIPEKLWNMGRPMLAAVGVSAFIVYDVGLSKLAGAAIHRNEKKK